MDRLGAAARRYGRALYVSAWNFSADDGFNHCAAISYYAMLSVIPFLVLLAALLGTLLGSSETGMQQALAVVRRVVPEFREEFAGGVQQLADHARALGTVSAIVALWTSSLVFASLQRAVNHVFRASERPLWGTVKPRLVFVGSAGLLVLGFLATNALAVAKSFNLYLGGTFIDLLVSSVWGKLAADLLLDFVVFSLLLVAMIPGRAGWKTLLPATALATLGWEVAKQLFALFLRHQATGLGFTGSAAAALVFMLWVYYAAFVVLLSFELLAVLRGDRGEPW